MSIIEELKRTVIGLGRNSDFLNKLPAAGDVREFIFLELFAEELTKKLSNYRVAISLRFNHIVTPFSKKPAEALGIETEKLIERICYPSYLERARDSNCKNKQCFGDDFLKGNEVDALIVRDGADLCFVEYESKRTDLCDNFMKMYWLRQLFNKPFESLFVTRLTTRKGDDTFTEFEQYMSHARPVLNCLLAKWAVMELVDLSSTRKRSINWEQ